MEPAEWMDIADRNEDVSQNSRYKGENSFEIFFKFQRTWKYFHTVNKSFLYTYVNRFLPFVSDFCPTGSIIG